MTDIRRKVNNSLILDTICKIGYHKLMNSTYQGHYSYNHPTIHSWNSSAIGVYYCGYPLQDGSLAVLYVGRAVGQGGIRGRLLEHLREELWHSITHFGYTVCNTIAEAEILERMEIARLQPHYNTQGKSPGLLGRSF